MHPEIRKFWEDEGYRIEICDATNIASGYKATSSRFICSIIETLAHGNNYRFNKIWYSEEEMLKIVRMKAFI